MNRRTKRSSDPSEALQYLVEALAERSDVSSVALVTEGGRIVAGMGDAVELRRLAAIAGPATRGEPCEQFDEVTRGTDFLGRRIPCQGDTLYLAALGSRVRRMHEAAAGITRILETSPF